MAARDGDDFFGFANEDKRHEEVEEVDVACDVCFEEEVGDFVDFGGFFASKYVGKLGRGRWREEGGRKRTNSSPIGE